MRQKDRLSPDFLRARMRNDRGEELATAADGVVRCLGADTGAGFRRP